MRSALVVLMLILAGCATVRGTTFSPCTDAKTGVPLKAGQASAWDVTTSEIPFIVEPHRVVGFVDAKGVCVPTIEGPVSSSLASMLSNPVGSMLTSPAIGNALIKPW